MIIQKLRLRNVHHLENAQQINETHIDEVTHINIAYVQFD